MFRPIAATVLGALTVGAVSVALRVVVVEPDVPDRPFLLAMAPVAVLIVVLGVVVAWRARRNSVGLVLTSVGALIGAVVARAAWRWLGYLGVVPRPSLLSLALDNDLGVFSFVAVATLLVIYPDGRLPGRRWGWLLVGLLVSAVLLVVSAAVSGAPNNPPFQDLPPLVPEPTRWQVALSIASVAVFFALLLVTACGGLARVRRADGVLRAQLRWVLVGASVFLVYPFVCGTEILLRGEPGWASVIVAILGLAALPVGVAIGMLRHDLYDVDRLLAETVSWGLVAGAAAAVLGLGTALGGLLFGAGSLAGAVVASALSFLALMPAYRLVRARMLASLYPTRRAALDGIRELERKVNRGEADPMELAAVLRSALRDPSLTVDHLRGELDSPSVTPRLLDELTEAAMPLFTAVRMRSELQASLAEVEASRARLVRAEAEARRRFERDLHDGAQQRLVSLGLSLRVAQRALATGSLDVEGVLDGAVAELSTAIAELRRLAHGIRPSVLDDGLPVAVASLARSVPIPVDVGAGEVGVVPDDTALTAYYVVAEALANAVKHSAAERIRIGMATDAGELVIAVSDDGVGGARFTTEGGLTGLEEGSCRGRSDEPERRHRHDGGGAPAMRIVIAEDSVLFREGLARLLADSGHEVVGKASDAPSLEAMVDELLPELVIADIRMPPDHTDDGARAARAIRARHPELGIVLLSQHVESMHSVALTTQGRFGYLLKDRVLDVDDFLSAVERVAKGGTALDPEVVARLLRPIGRADRLAALTPREREVLALMAEGLTNAAIARRLWLSERTIETHVSGIIAGLVLSVGADDHRRVLAVLAYLEAAG